MNRRLALRILGNTALVAGAFGAGRYFLLPPARSATLESVDTLAARFVASLDSEDRQKACVEYDHPFRQYHNRGVSGGGISCWGMSWEQRGILTDLLYAGLSDPGRARIPNEQLINFPGVHALKVLVCGDPKSPPYQLLLTGPHINLRLGGANREGVAFGGPQVYGDQRGNNDQGLPGNMYRYQFEAARRLYASLSPAQQQLAVLAKAPIQTQIELQGRDGQFSGVAVKTLTPESKKRVRELIDGILSTYHEDDVAYAQTCLEHNGGLDELFLSYYREGEVDKSGEYQIFRLEGPAAVFYFRGHPHVHAFINVAMNGEAPLSVGEVICENQSALELDSVKALFERAMQIQTGSDLAYYDINSVVGPLRKGTIRAGDIYNLESWQNRIDIVEMKGEDIRRQCGIDVDDKSFYSIATTGHSADNLRNTRDRQRGIQLRDATIDYLRKHGVS